MKTLGSLVASNHLVEVESPMRFNNRKPRREHEQELVRGLGSHGTERQMHGRQTGLTGAGYNSIKPSLERTPPRC